MPPKSDLFNELYIYIYIKKTRNNYWAVKVNKEQNHTKRFFDSQFPLSYNYLYNYLYILFVQAKTKLWLP